MSSTARLSWTPPTTNTDGSPITGTITYDIYGYIDKLGDIEPVLLASGLTEPQGTVSGNVPIGCTVCLMVRAVVNGAASMISEIVCGIITGA
jgi:hypothetical protein